MLLNILGTMAVIVLFHGGWIAIYRDIHDGEDPRHWVPGLVTVAVLLFLIIAAIWRH